MAAVSFTASPLTTWKDKCHVVTWSNMANGDIGNPIEMGGRGDRSVQLAGIFGSGTVVLEGSNDGINYITLSDVSGNALSATAPGIKQITECVRYMRPNVINGTGSTLITVTMFLRLS